MLNPREELLTLLRTLNLAAMGETVETAALRAAKEGLTHEAFLLELARIEQAARAGRRIERLRKQSDLLPGKTFRSLDLNRFDPATRMQMERLQGGAFLKGAINVVAIGPPGAGKSISIALWDMHWSNSAARCCSRQRQRWFSVFLPPSVTCACHRSWPNWIGLNASFWMTSAMFSMTGTRWKCCIRCWRSAMSERAW